MSTATTASPIPRGPELLGQTVVVIGGSAGIGLETARRARAEGANLILTGRNPERLQRAASELDALSTAAFDATDPAPLERFFRDLPTTIDHVMVTAGRPHYGRLVDMDFAQARRALDEHLLLVLQVARHAHKVGPGGTLLFMGGTGGRRPGIGLGIASTVTALSASKLSKRWLPLIRPPPAGFEPSVKSGAPLAERRKRRPKNWPTLGDRRPSNRADEPPRGDSDS